MAFKMNYNKDSFPYKDMGPTKRENMGYPKYSHDKGPTFNTKLREEAMDPNTTMNDDFKKEVLSSNTKNKHSHNTMRTPYEKNKYSSSHMPKHEKGHEELTPQTVNPDKKRKQSIINKLKELKDPVDSPEGKRLTNILMKDYNMTAEGVESEVGFR